MGGDLSQPQLQFVPESRYTTSSPAARLQRLASSGLKSQAPLPCMGAGSSSRFCTFTSDAQRDFDRWEAIKQRQGLHFDQISSNFSGQFCSIGEQSVILG